MHATTQREPPATRTFVSFHAILSSRLTAGQFDAHVDRILDHAGPYTDADSFQAGETVSSGLPSKVEV